MSLLTEDGTLYLIAGDHEPLNKEKTSPRVEGGEVDLSIALTYPSACSKNECFCDS